MKEKLERLRALKVTLLIGGQREYVGVVKMRDTGNIWLKDFGNEDGGSWSLKEAEVELTPELESFFALIGDAEILEYKECSRLSDQKPPVFALTKDASGTIHFYELKSSVWHCETPIRTESWAHKTAALFGLDPETLI